MDDRHTGFAGSYPSPNTNISLQSAQQYPYSSANPASTSPSAPATHSHQQLSKPFHAAGEQQQHMSLPPIQHFESHNGMQSHQQPPQPPSHAQPASQSQAQHQHAHSSSYAPAPPYQPTHYHQYQQNGALQAPMQTNLPPNGQNGMMRFPLPPQPSSLNSRQMIDSRHKREIKRRTKTGCLTCRKRRIKCDEGHPTCRNCTKSKRECLGYDPIFKQQPGPANIQPAPTGNGVPPLHYTNPLADVGANAAGSIASNPYSSQTYPSTASTFIPNPGAPQGSDGHLEYGNSLDPALAAGENPHSMAQSQYSHALLPQRKVKQISIEELFLINDIPPIYDHRENPPPITPSMREDVESFFKYHYAAGLDRFFETTWYGSRGLACLMSDASLLDFVGQCTEQFKAKVETKAILSLEARLVWQLAIMPRTASSTSYESANDPLMQELLMRLDVVENLLTGQFMDPTKVPPGNTGGPGDPAHLEIPFWHHLGRFVTLHDDLSNPSTTKDVMECLSVLRNILTMIESRDVLYSIAVVRHIGGRMSEFHPNRQIVAPTADRESALTMVQVAQTFLDNETTRGSTQILQRVCCMAIQGFILQKQ